MLPVGSKAVVVVFAEDRLAVVAAVVVVVTADTVVDNGCSQNLFLTAMTLTDVGWGAAFGELGEDCSEEAELPWLAAVADVGQSWVTAAGTVHHLLMEEVVGPGMVAGRQD